MVDVVFSGKCTIQIQAQKMTSTSTLKTQRIKASNGIKFEIGAGYSSCDVMHACTAPRRGSASSRQTQAGSLGSEESGGEGEGIADAERLSQP